MMNSLDSSRPNAASTTVLDGVAGSTELTLIPVIEEQLEVGKQVVETGRLLISKDVHKDEQVVTIPLMHEELSVERVPINQYIDVIPAVRYEGDLTIVPVVKEVLVTEKKLVLVEEVRITKRLVTAEHTQHVTLQREEVTVERIANGTDVRPETRSSL